MIEECFISNQPASSYSILSFTYHPGHPDPEHYYTEYTVKLGMASPHPRHISQLSTEGSPEGPASKLGKLGIPEGKKTVQVSSG